MAKATSEILIGTGTLYTAPTGTSFPADPSVAPGSAWVDIGYSEEGWSFNVDRTTEDIHVAEDIDAIDVLQTAREVHVVGTVVQVSLANISLGIGGGTITSAGGIDTLVPGSTDTLQRKSLLLRVKAPGTGNSRDIQIPYAIAVGAVELAYKKAPDKAQIAIDFRALKVTGTDIFTIKDET